VTNLVLGLDDTRRRAEPRDCVKESEVEVNA
jgi:hypothetical protein